jgi:transcription termination/antitermination protein NusA
MTDLIDAMLTDTDTELRAATGTITAITHDAALVRLRDGRDAVLPRAEWYPQRPWHVGQDVVVAVIDDTARPVVSVTDRRLVVAVLDGIIPELLDGRIRVMGVARMPGVRTKVAVAATVADLDPVRAIVGRNANRLKSAEALLIDRLEIIAWHADPAEYVKASLAPIVPDTVTITAKGALVTVPAHVHAAALGGGGLNVALAARLTGVHIDVSISQGR